MVLASGHKTASARRSGTWTSENSVLRQRHSPGRGDREASLLGEGIGRHSLPVAANGSGLAGVARDSAYDVVADPGIGRGGDAAANGQDLRHVRRQSARDCRRQHRNTGDTGEGEDAHRSGRCVQSLDAFDEIGPVGEIEVMDAARDVGLDDPVSIRAVGLEWLAGIDQDVWLRRGELLREIAIAIERGGHQLRDGLASGAEGLRTL
jgi:hypothetical protein